MGALAGATRHRPRLRRRQRRTDGHRRRCGARRRRRSDWRDPAALADREIAHAGVTDLRVVDSMHTRKAMMAELSDAFIAMPGGVGTFEEFFEAVTWTQLGVHRKPCGLLNVGGFYTPLAAFIDQAVTEGFIKPIHRAMIVVDDDPERLLDSLADDRSFPTSRNGFDRERDVDLSRRTCSRGRARSGCTAARAGWARASAAATRRARPPCASTAWRCSPTPRAAARRARSWRRDAR